MTLTRLASDTDNITMTVVAVLLLGLFVVRPIVAHLIRQRRRAIPLRAEAALCRRLRQTGHVYHPAENPKTRAAFAATRARLVEQMHRNRAGIR